MSSGNPRDSSRKQRDANDSDHNRRLGGLRAAAGLVYEIAAAAPQIVAARTWTNELAQRADATWQMLDRMAAVTHVLRVIRQRLERAERERLLLAREARERDRLSRDGFFR
jgi:hypothetical protein